MFGSKFLPYPKFFDFPNWSLATSKKSSTSFFTIIVFGNVFLFLYGLTHFNASFISLDA